MNRPASMVESLPVGDLPGFQKETAPGRRRIESTQSTDSCVSEAESVRTFSDSALSPKWERQTSWTPQSSHDAEVSRNNGGSGCASPKERHLECSLPPEAAVERRHQLDLLICAGDLLFVQDIREVESTRVCAVMAAPMPLARSCRANEKFYSMMPNGDRSELWLICVLEWSKDEQRLRTAQKVFYIESTTRRLVLVGGAGEGSCAEYAPVEELQQCPLWLRARLRTDLMRQALANMVTPWDAEGSDDEALKPFRDAWQGSAGSSCVGVVVTFWQLYLIALARSIGGAESPCSVLRKWMPLMADSAGLVNLRSTLREVGWINLRQIPLLKQPVVGTLPPRRAPEPQSERCDVVVKSGRSNKMTEAIDKYLEEIPDEHSSLDALENPMDVPSDDDDSLVDLARTRGRLSRSFAPIASGNRLTI